MQRRVVEALDRLTGDPPAGDVVRLAGIQDEWRLRVGDWRVRFTRDRDTGVIQVLTWMKEATHRDELLRHLKRLRGTVD